MMEDWTKEQVMALNNDELLVYINHMLAIGYSLGRLNKEKGIRRQTVRDRLKKDGYVYNDECKAFIKPLIDEPKQTQPPKTTHKARKEGGATISLEELLERVEALEMRFNAIQNNETKNKDEFKPIIFNSKQQPRNYPLHKEVVDLLAKVSQVNPHLKVKDIVNHCLYIGLSQALHSDNEG